MEEIFEEYNTVLENQQETQESIRKHVRNLQNFARIVTFNRSKLHTVLDKGVDDREVVVDKAPCYMRERVDLLRSPNSSALRSILLLAPESCS